MKYANITGWGKCLPPAVLTNDDLSTIMDTSDEWIYPRTGIKARRVSHVSTQALATLAARRALACAGLEAGELDGIILATATPGTLVPNGASAVQQALGAHKAAVFDLNAACTGFVYALSVATSLVQTGMMQKVLVIGAERLIQLLDWAKRDTAVLFGDGAGAVVLEASEKPGILATAAHADGSHHGILSVPGGVCGGKVTGDPFLRMDGQAVFKFAVRVLADVAKECCTAAGVPSAEIDWLVPHQANIRIIESTSKKLGLPADKVVVTVDQHGNTSAASIPLALDAAVRDGRIRRGQKIMLEGVGGGFTWGAVLLEF